MNKKKQILNKTQISKIDREKLEILRKTDQVKGEQLSINKEGKLATKKELKDFAIGNIENPTKKYEVYYNGITKLLRKHLPKGKENRKSRNFIYEEKNVYLTRGKRISKIGIRGADGRMGYIGDAQEVLKMIMDWIFSNGTMVELFNSLRVANLNKGYGTRQF